MFKQMALASSLMILLCSATSASWPTVSATVTQTEESVVYSYQVVNTTASDIYLFSVFTPPQAVAAVTSLTTSKEAWSAGIARLAPTFAQISWGRVSGTVGTDIKPMDTAWFTLTTAPGIPTISGFTFLDKGTNWGWGGFPYSGFGSTSLPVPAPEPSPLLALAAGIGGMGFLIRRRR